MLDAYRVPESYRSAAAGYSRPASGGVQLYEQVGEDQLAVDAVGRPLPHLSAQKHTTGEAVYIDDMPHIQGRCVSVAFCVFVSSVGCIMYFLSEKFYIWYG